jgi:hypothetical protein
VHDIEQADSSDLFDVDKIEAAEKQLDAFINSRSRDKEKANEEEELWRASERRVLQKRRRANRQAWLDHHAHLQAIHLDLANTHASRRSRLLAEEFSPDEGPDTPEAA